jgi:hypothetical protein
VGIRKEKVGVEEWKTVAARHRLLGEAMLVE